MATKTIYVPDEDLPVFDKAKSLAGDSLSAVVIQALKDFILRRELEEKAFVEIKRWKGTENLFHGTVAGHYFKFYGKKLSEASDDMDPRHPFHYELFLTRKNNYLLYIVDEDQASGVVKSSFVHSQNVRDLLKSGFPTKLIIDAEKQMPGTFCEEVDI